MTLRNRLTEDLNGNDPRPRRGIIHHIDHRARIGFILPDDPNFSTVYFNAATCPDVFDMLSERDAVTYLATTSSLGTDHAVWLRTSRNIRSDQD